MAPRVGVTELLVIVILGVLLLGTTLVVFLLRRRRRPGSGFPVVPRPPAEVEEPRRPAR